MIDLHEIDTTIEEIRREGHSMQAVEKLALLYVARDYMLRESEQKENAVQGAVFRPSTRLSEDASEFRVACMGVSFERIIDVLDEHMEAIRLMYPKEYDTILQKILTRP